MRMRMEREMVVWLSRGASYWRGYRRGGDELRFSPTEEELRKMEAGGLTSRRNLHARRKSYHLQTHISIFTLEHSQSTWPDLT